MSQPQDAKPVHSFNDQIAVWRRQSNSIPGLLGGKAVWVPLVLKLVELLGDAEVIDLDSSPKIPEEIFLSVPALGGAEPGQEPATWRQYLPFLRGVGLAKNGATGLTLTAIGRELLADPRPALLGKILADKVRLFAETLAFIATEPMTIEDVHEGIQTQYHPSWKNLGGTRSRMDWQEKLELVTPISNRRWEVTAAGQALLVNRILVSPDAFESLEDVAVELTPAPLEISTLLDELRESVREHQSRSTYNIWAPSPPTSPNKVENLRTIINAALTRIERSELFAFICETFCLKRSSAESMMPFLRASGVLVEVGRGVYEATAAAKAWIESADDINFIRILHAHMRFVGEMVLVVEPGIERSQMYEAGKQYGLNVEKCRWIASFLLNTGLIEEPRYGSLRATSAGIALLQELPLSEAPKLNGSEVIPEVADRPRENRSVEEPLKARLMRLSQDPQPNGTKPGSAFEYAVRDAFREMGFQARVISGSGDTDVLVQWQGDDGTLVSAVVEAKSRSNGHVSHTDISDVALETHKGRHNAEFIAVVGSAFSGDTIRNMADQRNWSLIEAERLGTLVETVNALGLRPCEAASIFRSTKGLSELDDLIAERTRELDVVSFIFTKLEEEVGEGGEAISARDISRDGRKTDLAPSVTEVAAGIELVAGLQVGAFKQIDAAERPEYGTYVIGDVSASVNRLRAFANAIERRSAG
ncbi:restriction endonuclease [Leucobacter sp. GX0328]